MHRHALKTSTAARSALRVCVLDNDDSFTWNIVDALRCIGAECTVVSSQRASIEAVLGDFDGVLLGPGPCTPNEAGIALEVARRAARPVLGVCLGHQVIAQAFGATVKRARTATHGAADEIHHDGRGVFMGLSSPISMARYHSLAVDDATLPFDLEVSARTSDGEVMALRHRSRAIESVQFHPESWLSEGGEVLFANWLGRVRGC